MPSPSSAASSGPMLVTGGTGFVGPHVLAELGADAVALDLDVTDLGALTTVVRELAPRAVAHLAALSSVALADALADARTLVKTGKNGVPWSAKAER